MCRREIYRSDGFKDVLFPVDFAIFKKYFDAHLFRFMCFFRNTASLCIKTFSKEFILLIEVFTYQNSVLDYYSKIVIQN